MNTFIAASRGIHVLPRPEHWPLEQFLEVHFGPNFSWVEGSCLWWVRDHSDLPRELCSTTAGWKWYELTNGGAFMAPEDSSGDVFVQAPHYRGRFRVQSAAIVACLHVFNELHFHHQGAEFDRHYRLLRRFVVGLPDAVDILDASEH